jgi:DnaJ family protein C protein 2
MEVLSNPEKRRQFDSIDPHYTEMEESLPSATSLQKTINANPQEFFEVFAPVFALEARFYNGKADIANGAPPLGKMDDSKKEVEAFYDAWYNFESWRSFEYLDKEVNEGSDS